MGESGGSRLRSTCLRRIELQLELFRDTLGCGTIRKAGNDGWYFEVNRLGDLVDAVVPFFDRFPLVREEAA